MKSDPYNTRLFTRGTLRPYFHHRRYFWLRKQLDKLHLEPKRVIELGCFDAKSLHFFPSFPERYLGLDANWEGGLELGRTMWRNDPRVELQLCEKPDEIHLRNGERFDLGIGMEVFEYLPDEWLEGYLETLGRLIDGYFFISVPVERGLPFAIRYLGKAVLGFNRFSLTPVEFCNLVLGRTDRVAHEGHKGFDDRQFLRVLGRYFDILGVVGLFPGFGPRSLNFQLALIAHSRSQKAEVRASLPDCAVVQ